MYVVCFIYLSLACCTAEPLRQHSQSLYASH
jgi:hypothetical protein